MRKILLILIIIIALILSTFMSVGAKNGNWDICIFYEDEDTSIGLVENLYYNNHTFEARASAGVISDIIYNAYYTISVTANVVYNDYTNDWDADSYSGYFDNYTTSSPYIYSYDISAFVTVSEAANVNCFYGDCAMSVSTIVDDGQCSLYWNPFTQTLVASRTVCLSAGIDF